MGKMVKGFTLILILVACLVPSYTNSTLVKGQVAKYVSVNVTSPIENQTYQTHIIPLNFTWDTNVSVSIIEKVDYSVNLDGQYGHHDGHDIAMGRFQNPPFLLPITQQLTCLTEIICFGFMCLFGIMLQFLLISVTLTLQKACLK